MTALTRFDEFLQHMTRRAAVIAAASRTVLSMFAVIIALKTLAVVNNAFVLALSVQLFEFAHYVVSAAVLSVAVAVVRLRSDTALRRRTSLS